MNRRELLQYVGALGAGAAVGATAEAADHGARTGAAKSTPVAGPHAHFCGIHVAKNNPKLQFVTQHYCVGHKGGEHGADLFQCLLFDSTEANAKLVGVEYIVSDEVYRGLPAAEKPYWHPHTYEVLAGGLIAPGMDPADEQKFMKMILTTWGKTWHTWPDPTTPVPMGEPLLIWAITGDGQADPPVLARRDAAFGVQTDKIRARRIQEIGMEVPQVSPKEMKEAGRQWTDSGADKPTPKK